MSAQSPTSLNGWSMGRIGTRTGGAKDESPDAIAVLTDRKFLQHCAALSSPTRSDDFLQAINNCALLFSSSPDTFSLLSRLLFGGEDQSGLLSLTGTRAVTGEDSLSVCSLAEEALEVALTRGWAPAFLNFFHFHRLEQGRTSLLSSEVLEWISRAGGLLDLVHQRSDGAVLLLYFFLSVGYEGAPHVWNGLRLMGMDAIHDLCHSLVGYLLRGSLADRPDSVSVCPFAYHLLHQIVMVLHWHPVRPESESHSSVSLRSQSSSPELLSDQIVQSLRAFSSKYSIPPHLALVLPPITHSVSVPQASEGASRESSPRASKDKLVLKRKAPPSSLSIPVAVTESPASTPTPTPGRNVPSDDVSVWESRFRSLERMVLMEKQRSERLERELHSHSTSLAALQAPSRHRRRSSLLNTSTTANPRGDEEEDPFSIVTPRSMSDSDLTDPSDRPAQTTAPEGVSGVLAPGDFGKGEDWHGFGHPECALRESAYALLQHRDGQYTALNKASGPGYVALSVAHEPKVVVDDSGNMGIGVLTPRAKLHVDGVIRCGAASFGMTAMENLTVLRGGFSCRTLEPNKGPGWSLQSFQNGMMEIKFDHPFARRPSVFAVQNIPQQSPSLVPIGFVETAKFGFMATFPKSEIWIEFFIFGQRAPGWL